MQNKKQAATELASVVQTVADRIDDTDELMHFAHRTATRTIGVPPNTLIGGDTSDLVENLKHGRYTIMEDDPRYNLYWAEYQAAYVRVLLNVVAEFTPRPELTW